MESRKGRDQSLGASRDYGQQDHGLLTTEDGCQRTEAGEQTTDYGPRDYGLQTILVWPEADKLKGKEEKHPPDEHHGEIAEGELHPRVKQD